MRLGTSVKKGWYPAIEALDCYGSAARGDPVFDAGTSICVIFSAILSSIMKF